MGICGKMRDIDGEVGDVRESPSLPHRYGHSDGPLLMIASI